MAFLFKSVFGGGKTAVLNPPPGVSADLNLAPPKSSDGTAAAPATEPVAPAVNEAAVLQDFLIKNFLLDEPAAQSPAPETPVALAPAPEPPPAVAHTPEPPPAAAHIPEPPSKPEEIRDASPAASPNATPIAITLTELEKEIVTESEVRAADAPPPPPKVDSGEWALEETLANHKEWLDSHGATGGKADLQKAQFEDRELIGVNLRYADLQDANLKSADLLLADLRDACLVRANLQESCLVGVNLEGANLEGASLESAMGLLPRQLAGANLHEASLPGTIFRNSTPSRNFSALPTPRRACSAPRWLSACSPA